MNNELSAKNPLHVPRSPELLRNYLISAGVDVIGLEARKQLEIWDDSRTYLLNGTFDDVRMLNQFRVCEELLCRDEPPFYSRLFADVH